MPAAPVVRRRVPTRQKLTPTLGMDCPRLRREAAGAGAVSPRSDSRLTAATGEWVVSGQRPVRDRDLPPPCHAQLLAQDVRVRLGRTGRDAEQLADFLVGAAGRDQLDDLSLA